MKLFSILTVFVHFVVFVALTFFSLPQGFTGRECLWSHKAGAEVVPVWFLQEAKSKTCSLFGFGVLLYDSNGFKLIIKHKFS